MSTYTSTIQQMYVAYFNRPADVSGLANWEAYAAGKTLTALKSAISTEFAKAAEYTIVFQGMTTSQIVTKVYQNLLGRDPDVAGLTNWINHLADGSSTIASLVTDVIRDAGAGDVDTIANKVAAASAFTAALDTVSEINAYSGAAANLVASTWLSTVGSTAASLAAAITPAALTTVTGGVVTGSTSSVGSTYTLTTALDTPSSTSADDTYLVDNTGAAVTLSGADQINGGAGTDTLKIYTKTGVANTLPTGMTSVEKVWINGTDQSVDISANSGITTLELNAAIAAGSYTATVASGQKVIVSDQAAATTYTVTGAASITSQNLEVSKVGTTAANIISLTGTGVATVNLVSSGTLTSSQTNQVQLKNATGVKVDTINISGSSALDLQVGEVADTAQFAATGIKAISASAATGTTSVKINSKDSAGEVDLASTFSYTGGSGNDTLDLSIATVGGTAVSAAQLKLMTLNGGTAGTDTLIVSNTVGTGTTALTNLVGIDNIGVAAANGTINVANFTGVTGLALSGTAAGGVTVNNLGSTGILAQGTSVDGANSLTVNATGTVTTDALAWSVGSAAAALGANTGAVAINGYETITLTSQGAANTLGAGGITLAASAGGNETLNVVATKGLTLAGALTLSGAATSIAISGAGAVTVAGVITAGSLTNTGTGAFTATGANKVLNFDASTNTAAVSFTDSAATSAAILKGGDGGVTFVGSAFNDVITVGSGTNGVTGGGGADVITINHGTGTKATTLTLATPATDTGTATGFAATTAVPTTAFSTTTLDVVTGFKAGDLVQLTGLTTSAVLLGAASTTGAATVGDVILVKGTYSSSGNTFTANAAGTDSALVYDSNGTTAAGTYQAIVLVGYVDAGAADTISTGGLFTAVA
jgi:trimeric autotransporter adhesin